MRELLYTTLLAGFILTTHAQQLTLEQCYEKARLNYPLVKQKELLSQSKEYSIANVRSGYLPQITINGQATYQSAVTQVPVESPLFNVEPLSKDQYKVFAELNQTIYDGGVTKRAVVLQQATTKLDDQKIEIELYKIKERINQLFFGILLVNEQLKQTALVKEDLTSGLKKIQAAIRNGTALRTNADILEAELLKNEQRVVELLAMRKAYVEMLGLFIHEKLEEGVLLQQPPSPALVEDPMIKRPEMSFYSYQRELYNTQHQASEAKLTPRLTFFLQGGYGRPALNMLKNEFEGYYVGGVRFNWNLGGFYNTNRDKQLLELNQESVNRQQDTFEFNTKLQLRQQNNELAKLMALIELDKKLVEVRTRVKETANAQLENGVITANDYLRELTAEDQARQNMTIHQLHLLLTQYSYMITSGN